MKKVKSAQAKAEQVIQFMDALEHPFKAEVQAVRDSIRHANNEIAEEIKWNAPSFSYGDEYIVTFNLSAKKHVHLVFHNPGIGKVQSEILEGDYADRRMAYFSDMADVSSKKEELQRIVREVINLIDAA